MRRDRTAIGNVDSPSQAWVDTAGRLQLPGRSWSLAWWVRAADRWHVPDRESGTAISQRLVDAAPVVETGMRVPGGQVLHRAWCVVDGAGAEWAVVEVEDRSREPIGVAVAVDGARRLGFRDRTIVVDGEPAVVLPRDPSRFTAAPDDGGTTTWPGDVRSRAGDASIAAVFPVAHTATVRFAVPLGGSAGKVDLAALASADRVAAGWRAHAQPPGSMRVELPEPDGAAVAADRAALLVVCDDPAAPVRDVAAALSALDRFGHHTTVGGLLPGLVADLRAARWDGAGRVLVAVAQHHRLTSTTPDDELVGPVAEAAHKLRRRAKDDPWTTLGQLAAAELLDAAGQAPAAARCRELAAAGPSPDWRPVDHGVPAAARLDAVHGELLHDEPDGVAVLPGHRDAWLGQGVEVHDAPTRFGRVSFAVRWHGARPALLWQSERPVRLTAPGLDRSWSTEEARGEALLAPVEPPGGLPKVVAPLGGAGVAASDAPEGGTFA